MEKLDLKIEGMTCGHCQKAVTNILSSVDGVQSVDVSLLKNSAEIKYDAGKVSKDEIINAVNESGMYKAN